MEKHIVENFLLLLYNLFQKHINDEEKFSAICKANSCRHVPIPIKKVNATMAVRNMQVKTQSRRNKAPIQPKFQQH